MLDPSHPLVRAGRRAADLLLSAPSAEVGLARARALVEDDWLPALEGREELVERLDRAAAASAARAPLSRRDVEKVLAGAWDEKPSKVLEDLSDEPVARTPGSQVHRAVLSEDGRAVAVKVLRPGLAEQARNDLALVDAAASAVSGVLPAGVDAGAFAREVRGRLLDELDLEWEAQMARAARRALRGVEAVGVPEPVSALAADRVAVSAWVDGTPLRALAPGAQHEALAATLVRAHVHLAREGGIVQGDLDPDDVLVDADGTAWLLDWGAAAKVDRARAGALLDAAVAVLEHDREALASAFAALGAERAAAGDALALAREALGADVARTGAVSVDAAWARAAGERALDVAPRALELAERVPVAPQDLWPLRSLGGLVGLVLRLGAPVDLAALARG